MKSGECREAEKEPLISVIVPVYNIMDYLSRCVQSLRQQTYRNLEILLVDDGSTDGTGQLCDRLAAEDERIHVLHKENGGTSSARNMGIEKARGNSWALLTAMIMWSKICIGSCTRQPKGKKAG